MSNDIWKCRCGSRNIGPGNICPNCRDVRTQPAESVSPAPQPQQCIHCGKAIFDNGTVYVHRRDMGLVNGIHTVFETQWCDENCKKWIAETEMTNDVIGEVTPEQLARCVEGRERARSKVTAPQEVKRFGFRFSRSGYSFGEQGDGKYVLHSDYAAKCAELQKAESSNVSLREELEQEQAAHDEIANLLLPLVGTADGTSVSCAKRAASQLADMRKALQKAESELAERLAAREQYRKVCLCFWCGELFPMRRDGTREEKADDLTAHAMLCTNNPWHGADARAIAAESRLAEVSAERDELKADLLKTATTVDAFVKRLTGKSAIEIYESIRGRG